MSRAIEARSSFLTVFSEHDQRVHDRHVQILPLNHLQVPGGSVRANGPSHLTPIFGVTLVTSCALAPGFRLLDCYRLRLELAAISSDSKAAALRLGRIMLLFCSRLLARLRHSNRRRSYKPQSERCVHLHLTVVEAVQCAAELNCELEIVAINHGRVEALSVAEQRVCDFIADYLALRRNALPHKNQASTLRSDLLTRKSTAQTLQPSPEYKRLQRTAFKNQYRCPYRSKGCGDNANYCSRCNEDYAEFLMKIR